MKSVVPPILELTFEFPPQDELGVPTHDPLSQPRLWSEVIGRPGRRDALVVHLGTCNWPTKADPRLGAKTSDSRTTSRPGTDICQFLIRLIDTNYQQLTNRNPSHLNSHPPSCRMFRTFTSTSVENSLSPRAVTLLRRPRTSSKPPITE